MQKKHEKKKKIRKICLTKQSWGKVPFFFFANALIAHFQNVFAIAIVGPLTLGAKAWKFGARTPDAKTKRAQTWLMLQKFPSKNGKFFRKEFREYPEIYHLLANQTNAELTFSLSLPYFCQFMYTIVFPPANNTLNTTYTALLESKEKIGLLFDI